MGPRALWLVVAAAMSCAAWGSAGHEAAEALSEMTIPAAAATPLFLIWFGGPEDDARGRRIGDAVAAGALASGLMQQLIDEDRPCDPNATDGFPSGHTATAFALATAVADQYPRWKWPAFAWAAAVGWSRHRVRYHYWHQVLAGAFVGWGMARLSLSARRGLFGGVIVRETGACELVDQPPGWGGLSTGGPEVFVTVWQVRW